MADLDKQRSEVAVYFRSLQDRICTVLAEIDGKLAFREDAWQRPGGGGGRSRILTDGAVFEKAGVNFSEVHGQMSPDFAQQLPGEGLDFTATGISLVLHPRNPKAPTSDDSSFGNNPYCHSSPISALWRAPRNLWRWNVSCADSSSCSKEKFGLVEYTTFILPEFLSFLLMIYVSI